MRFGSWRPARIGRAQIEKAFTGLFKSYKPEYDKITKVAVIGNDTIASINSFGGTFTGQNGPEAVKGYATFVYVRDGGTWKIRLESVSIED
jgi:ketosteroid isomerase-like protein